MTEYSQVSAGKRLDRKLYSVQMTAYGEVFASELNIIPSRLGFERLDSRKTLFPEVKQQIQLLFYFKFTLNFVDPGEKSASFGFQEVVGVDRPVLNSGGGH